MRIVVLHGQMHKGSTYHITKLFIDNITEADTEINEFFLPESSPPYCIGCFNCFTKGEDLCPHSSNVAPIVQAMEDADLIILESPCYVFGMSGQLKTLLDHLGYQWMAHRPNPKMFHKVGLVISTAAGAGTGKVTNALKNQLFYWGIPRIYRYGRNIGAMNWETVKPEKRLTMEKEIKLISSKITKDIKVAKPGFQTKMLFRIMRLNQKSNTWNPIDKDFWVENGWLSGKNPW